MTRIPLQLVDAVMSAMFFAAIKVARDAAEPPLTIAAMFFLARAARAQHAGAVMGLRIYAADDSAPTPREIRIKVTCDGSSHGLFEIPSGDFKVDAGDHPRAAAQREGWKFRGDGRVMCASCAAILVREATAQRAHHRKPPGRKRD